ncbi:MAG: outer membrane protein assembly factor BamE [Reyranellaceae bacterium]
MKRLVLALPVVLSIAACAAPARTLGQIQPGMSREQVQSLIGPPQTVAHSPGKECAYYTLLKDFWSRVPWSVSDRYYVCYDQGRVEAFGKVDGPPSDL